MWATIWRVLLELWSICVLAAIICRSQCTSRGRMRRPSSPSGKALSVRVASHWPLPLIWWIFDQCIYWTVCMCRKLWLKARVLWVVTSVYYFLTSSRTCKMCSVEQTVSQSEANVSAICNLCYFFLAPSFFHLSMGHTRHRPSATMSTISRHALRMMPMLFSFFPFSLVWGLFPLGPQMQMAN